MSSDKKCRWCDTLIDIYDHGNRSYCDDDCYYEAKKYRTNEKYWEQKDKLDEFVKVDEILKIFFKMYGSDNYIPSDLLESAGMDWTISNGKKDINKITVTIIGEYGYALFNDQTLRIWKL